MIEIDFLNKNIDFDTCFEKLIFKKYLFESVDIGLFDIHNLSFDYEKELKKLFQILQGVKKFISLKEPSEKELLMFLKTLKKENLYEVYKEIKIGVFFLKKYLESKESSKIAELFILFYKLDEKNISENFYKYIEFFEEDLNISGKSIIENPVILINILNSITEKHLDISEKKFIKVLKSYEEKSN